jgi:hypothetical protein
MLDIIINVICGRAKRRHLYDLATETNMRKSKAPANEPAIAKQRTHFVRRGIRRYVKVLGMQIEHRITHTAANQKRLISRLIESVKDLQCAF